MNKRLALFKGKFWALSAVLFGPWHAPLLASAVSRLAAGTAFETYVSAHYHQMKSLLVVVFSLYFVVAFMMWVVGRQPTSRPHDGRDEMALRSVPGLSLKQIIGWGLAAMAILPALVAMSALGNRAYFVETFKHIFGPNPAMNAGLIWLISISTVIMIPTMVIWMVWMWQTWTNGNPSGSEAESWGYEYD